ncbi:MAG TPA: DUF167 domain-containing protein [Planctomycetota bacterium]|jgi:hypothetical protein
MRITVRVHPRASANRVEGKGPDEYEVWVTAPPADNQANEAVRGALAKHLKVAKSRVRLFRGGSARVKVFDVE